MQFLLRLSRVLVFGLPIVLVTPVGAQTLSAGDTSQAPDGSEECTVSAVEYEDEAGLTLAEIIRRVDRALTRSLNRYDECQNQPETLRESEELSQSENGGMSGEDGAEAAAQGAASASGSAAAAARSDITGEETATTGEGTAQAGGVEGEGESRATGAGAPSVAAGDIAGDEPEPRPGQQARIPGGDGAQNSGQAGGTGDGTVRGTDTQAMQNGKLPEDIPAADNDSVLEAQIRQAAIDEPDPELKKKLWNEYRKYKGLPQVN